MIFRNFNLDFWIFSGLFHIFYKLLRKFIYFAIEFMGKKIAE